MPDANNLSITEADALMRAGKLTAVQLAEACLARVNAREAEVRAWVHVNADEVLAQARAADREPRRSALHGIPVGIKDIIDVAGMPAEYGSPIYAGHKAQTDAACVAAFKKAGALIMGKTVTTEFAMRHPNKTRNPLNLAHTPGGSSSGSAAGVADGMMPLALGTQTGGSVLRPSSYCGVVGFKPTFNIINRVGVKPNSESLDTVGLIARCVEDIALALPAITECAAPVVAAVSAPRIALCRAFEWKDAEPASVAAVEAAAAVLSRAGAKVTQIQLPPAFDAMSDAHAAINDYEAFRALSHEIRTAPEKLSPSLRPRLPRWAARTVAQYTEAQQNVADCQRLLRDVFRDVDAFLVPSAPGEAPLGLDSTGEAIFNRVWTALHVPAITLPGHTGPKGLPVGVQLVGAFGDDYALLATAAWAQPRLR
ncbi:MAG: amidase [Betaproteobacteria bacterium]|nr:amidase [Betaproteobacteria bacterium]